MVWHNTAILSPSKRLLRRTVCWDKFNRESVDHLSRMPCKGTGQSAGHWEGQKGDHTTPAPSPPPATALQTPLSAAPKPNSLPLPLRPFVASFPAIQMSPFSKGQQSHWLDILPPLHHAANELVCLNTMTSPSRSSYKFLPKILLS